MSQRLALVRAAQLRAAALMAQASAPPSTVAAVATASRLQGLGGDCVKSSPLAGVDRRRSSTALFNRSGSGGCIGRRRGISTTPAPRDDAKKADAAAAAAAAAPPAAETEPAAADVAEAKADETPAASPTPFEAEVASASSGPDDPVPEYQNPRHHNNPDHQRVFDDEFGPDETPPVAAVPPFDDGSGKVLASPELHDIADAIVNMTMIEVNELCNRIGEHFGIEDDAGSMMAAGEGEEDGEGEGAEAEVKEEKTVFDLKLLAFDAKSKIKVIKEVRTMAGLGLKEAKEAVEGVPKVVMKDIKKEEAEELKAKLEALGATVEIV